PSLPPVRDPSGRLAGGCDQPNEPRWVRRQEHPRRRRYASGMPDPIASPAALPVPPAGPLLVLVAMPEEAAPLHARLAGARELATLRADGRGEGHGVRRGLMLSGDAFVTADLAAP